MSKDDSGYGSMEEDNVADDGGNDSGVDTELLPPLVKAPKPTPKALRLFLEKEEATFKRHPITKSQLLFLMKMFFDTKETFGMGRDRMFNYIVANHPEQNISRRKINRFLQSLEITQLFNPIKATKDIAVSISNAPLNRMEMDLLDLSNMESEGKKFVFVLVDTFSKYVVAVALEDKEEQTVLKAVRTALKELKDKYGKAPKSILSDNGSEFVNKKFKAYMKTQGITQIFTKAEREVSHAKQVENFNGYIRRQIAKYDNQFDNPLWTQYLQLLIDNYNKSPSRITKKTPVAIMEGQTEGVKDNIKKNVLPKNNKRGEGVVYKRGTVVRLKQEMGSTFEKPSNNIRWSRELYRVDKIFKPKADSTLQPKYRIRTYDDDSRIDGFFYQNDLREVSPDMIKEIDQEPKFVVQSLLDIKFFRENGVSQGKVLVKWIGYKDATWEHYGVIKEDVPKMLKNLEAKLKRKKNKS